MRKQDQKALITKKLNKYINTGLSVKTVQFDGEDFIVTAVVVPNADKILLTYVTDTEYFDKVSVVRLSDFVVRNDLFYSFIEAFKES